MPQAIDYLHTEGQVPLDTRLTIIVLHCVTKKEDTKLMAVTLSFGTQCILLTELKT